MIYFIKNENNRWFTIIPSIILTLIYNDLIELKFDENGSKSWMDENGNILTDDVSISIYLSIWYLSHLLLIDLIEDKVGYEKNKIKLADKFVSNLGGDSLDLVEIALYFEKTLGIPFHEELKFEQVIDLVDYIFLILIRRIEKTSLGWRKNDFNSLYNW